MPKTVELNSANYKSAEINSKIINQIENYLKMNKGDAKVETKIEIQLNPVSLGKLNVEIKHENKEIVVKIVAENKDVQKLLQDETKNLENIFKESLLKENNVTVEIAQDKSSSHNYNHRERQQKRKSHARSKRAAMKGR